MLETNTVMQGVGGTMDTLKPRRSEPLMGPEQDLYRKKLDYLVTQLIKITEEARDIQAILLHTSEAGTVFGPEIAEKLERLTSNATGLPKQLETSSKKLLGIKEDLYTGGVRITVDQLSVLKARVTGQANQ